MWQYPSALWETCFPFRLSLIHIFHNEPVGGGKPLGYSQGMLINAFAYVDEIPSVKRGRTGKGAYSHRPASQHSYTAFYGAPEVGLPARNIERCRGGLHYPAHNKLTESHGIFFVPRFTVGIHKIEKLVMPLKQMCIRDSPRKAQCLKISKPQGS